MRTLKRKILHIVLFLYFIVPSYYLFAKSNAYSVEHITRSEGLNNASGHCIIQGSDGFIWIGTVNGLIKYDGIRFTQFVNDTHIPTSLSNNYINSLIEDSKGNIWVGTNQGALNKFNKYSGKFKRYNHQKDDSTSIGAGSVYSILEDTHGNIWVAVNPSGLYFFNPETEKFYRFWLPEEKQKPNKKIRAYSLFLDSDDEIWLGTNNGVYRIKPNFDRQFTERSKFNDFNFIKKNNIVEFWNSSAKANHRLSNNEVVSIAEQRTKNGKIIWLGLWPGISKIEFAGQKVTLTNYTNTKSSVLTGNTWRLFIDSRNTLWTGQLINGISYTDLNKTAEPPQFSKLVSTDANFDISKWTIRYITEDSTGNIWAGSKQYGLLKIKKSNLKVKDYKYDVSNPQSLSGNFIKSILIDSKKQVWVGTNFNGLNRFKFDKNGSIKNLKHYSASADSNTLPNENIRDLFEDSQNRIWIACLGQTGGVALYNPDQDNFSLFRHDPLNENSLTENQVTVISEDSNGDLLFGTSEKGLDRFNFRRKTFQHYVHDPLDSSSLSSNIVLSILKDNDGRIWVGTYGGGLNKYIPEIDGFERYSTQSKPPLSDDRISEMYQDSKGYIWIATRNGLDKFDPDSKNIENFSIKDGFNSQVFLSINEDKDKNLWLTTEHGLSKLDTRTMIVSNFKQEDGLPTDMFTPRTISRLENSDFLIGSNSGLLKIAPDIDFSEDRKPGKTAITSFKVFNTELQLDTLISYKKRIKLNYDQNFFSFDFVLLDFDNPKENAYKYRLRGLDENWTTSNLKNYVNFTDIDPGEYTFEVYGSNQRGVWSKNAASIHLEITPPLWKTLWFRTLSLITVIVLISFSVKIVTTNKYKKRLAQLEMEKKIREERERISSDLHDNIGANLSSIVTGLEITDNLFNRNEKERAQENIKELEQHTRETIDHLRQAIWSLQSEMKTCGELMDQVRDFIRKHLSMNESIHADIVCSLDERLELSPFNSLNIYRIIQEGLNNSFKYAQASKITITFFESPPYIINILIEDDGIGFDVGSTKSSGKGFGLQNIQRRADKLGANLTIESKPGHGTRIGLKLNTKIP